MNIDLLSKPDGETGSFSDQGVARPDDPLEDKAEWVRRLRGYADQVGGIATMIESGADCRSLLPHLIAVQAALGEVADWVVRHHLAVCLGILKGNADRDAPARARSLAEILTLHQYCGKHYLRSSEDPYLPDEAQAREIRRPRSKPVYFP